MDFAARSTVSGHKAYLHYGNVTTPTTLPPVEVSYQVSLTHAAEFIVAFEDGGSLLPDARLTSLVKGAMGGAAISPWPCDEAQRFDARVTVSRDGGPFLPPDRVATARPAFCYTLAAGSHQVRVRVEVLPTTYQSAGNYRFSPKVRLEPVASG